MLTWPILLSKKRCSSHPEKRSATNGKKSGRGSMFLLRPQRVEGHEDKAGVRDASGVKLDGREWKYVAEGGANVLFRHHPAEDSDVNTGERSIFHGKLLRVKKCDIVESAVKLASGATKKRRPKSSQKLGFFHRSSSVSVREGMAAVPYSAHYPHPAKVLEYATQDILPYLIQRVEEDATRHRYGNVFEQVAQLMEVDQGFLSELNEQLLTLESRPVHRRHSQVDIALQYVMVLPDVTLPPPDEDPLLLFDEAIDSEGSESGTSVDTASEGGADELKPTDVMIPDELDKHEFDALAAIVADELAATSAVVDVFAKARGSHTSEESDGSTVTASEREVPETDQDGEEEETEDDDDDVGIIALQRRRRVLSGNCNIFDCCFRNICVEIKPKIGFKPKGKLILDIKKRVCRFCMHQHYKRATGKVEEISEYCPLDLFSRDASRIRKALRALQRTPQNNFKVFVRSNADEVVNVITGLNADALPKGAAQANHSCRRKRMGLRHSCQSIGAENDLLLGVDDDNDRLLPDVVELLTEVLLKLEILEDLKKMQLLDHIGVDGMWHLQQLLARVHAASAAVPSGDTWSLGQIVDHMQTDSSVSDSVHDEGSLGRCLAFLDVALEQVPDVPAVEAVDSWRHLSLPAFEAFYEQLVQRFQVATTLKDCSLLLCLRRAVEEDGDAATQCQDMSIQHHHELCPSKAASPPRKKFDHLREYEHRVVFRDMVFNCVIAIVDLDVKSHKSVEDYYRLDDKIVRHYVHTFGDHIRGDVCIEDDIE